MGGDGRGDEKDKKVSKSRSVMLMHDTNALYRRTSQSTSPRHDLPLALDARRERPVAPALPQSFPPSTLPADVSFDFCECNEFTIISSLKKNTSRTKSNYEKPRSPRRVNPLLPMPMSTD